MSKVNSKKPILIRADAGGLLGYGHVMRMLALAQALRQRGIEAVFVSAQCHQSICERLKDEGFQHFLFENTEPGETRDSDQTLTLADQLEASWVFLDGYHFDLRYQRQINRAGFKVAIMEDDDHCVEWCVDLIVNQNLGAEGKAHSNSLSEGKSLTGCCFALLREEFRACPGSKRTKAWPPKRILVTMGGVDPDDATGLVLRSLEKVELKDIEVKVIIGHGNPNKDALALAASDSKHRVELLRDVSDMPTLYQWADAAITAGGSTCYEWMRYELPAAIVTIADNQEPIVKALVEKHAARALGRVEHLSEEIAAKHLQAWLAKEPLAQGSPLVDAHGAHRVAAFLDTQLTISIASARNSWINPLIKQFAKRLCDRGHTVAWVHDAGDAPPSDILFLLSYWAIVPPEVRGKHAHTLVVHASDLPKGRGWSPVTWQILEGSNEIPVCLFEAVDSVDAGKIYLRTKMRLQGNELIDQIREAQVSATFSLCENFIEQYPAIASRGKDQEGHSSEYPRRRPADSELNTDQTILEQFNQLRVADNDAYPAFFKHAGHCYTLRIERSEPPE